MVFVIALTACGNSNDSAAGNANTSEPEIEAETELIITATNYSFDQEEYHLKKGVPVKIIFKNDDGNHGILIPEFELQLNEKILKGDRTRGSWNFRNDLFHYVWLRT